MLVLTRKAQEKIRIGSDITITILRLKGKTVRIGIEAPGTVPVLRGELAVAIDQEESAKRGDPPQPPTAVDRGAARPGEGVGQWPKNASSSDSHRCVTHTRVPRSRVATVLPSMLGESGPLRAMLDRRGAPN